MLLHGSHVWISTPIQPEIQPFAGCSNPFMRQGGNGRIQGRHRVQKVEVADPPRVGAGILLDLVGEPRLLVAVPEDRTPPGVEGGFEAPVQGGGLLLKGVARAPDSIELRLDVGCLAVQGVQGPRGTAARPAGGGAPGCGSAGPAGGMPAGRSACGASRHAGRLPGPRHAPRRCCREAPSSGIRSSVRQETFFLDRRMSP